MIPDRHATDVAAPAHWMEHEMSVAAFPIMREAEIAGALCFQLCSQLLHPGTTPLAGKIADLIRLAFYDQEFYPVSSLELALMPPWHIQKQAFSSFRQRVNEEYKRSVLKGNHGQNWRLLRHAFALLLKRAATPCDPI